MRNYRYLMFLILTGSCLVGCQALIALPRTQNAPLDAPIQSRSIQQVESPANIGHMRAPATATLSVPVTIEVWAFVGSSGCDAMGTASLSVNEREQSATLRATATHWVGGGFGCPAIYPGFTRATVSFSPNATGTYLLSAEPFQAISEGERAYKTGQGITPTATLAIEVVAPVLSVLADGKEHDPGHE